MYNGIVDIYEGNCPFCGYPVAIHRSRVDYADNCDVPATMIATCRMCGDYFAIRYVDTIQAEEN